MWLLRVAWVSHSLAFGLQVNIPEGRSYRAFYDQASEVTEHYFLHTLLIKAVTRLSDSRGRTQTPLWMKGIRMSKYFRTALEAYTGAEALRAGSPSPSQGICSCCQATQWQ